MQYDVRWIVSKEFQYCNWKQVLQILSNGAQKIWDAEFNTDNDTVAIGVNSL